MGCELDLGCDCSEVEIFLGILRIVDCVTLMQLARIAAD